ncbi:family 16 glycoside hydrolase [Ascidiimonas aurantiaca]|uniref:family 16 glycoside hydrolase n=1 Tax=Ascidiimonas aurantiaca TaxID=1685432 RepID=UPI0030EF70F7
MKYISFFIALGMGSFTFSQQTTNVPMTPQFWSLTPESAFSFEPFDGKPTLSLNGYAEVPDFDFTDGTIEVSVYAHTERAFAGIFFRKQQATMDKVYLRMHKSKQVDAIQYTPIFGGESNWQLYREHQARIIFPEKGWNLLKIEIQGSAAIVFVNEKEVLKIEELKSEMTNGSVGLWSLFNNRFADFKITPKKPVIQTKTPVKITPGVVGTWWLSKAFPASDFNDSILQRTTAQTPAQTETSGLLPISKYVEKNAKGAFENNPEDFVIATITIDAETTSSKRFSFDYSDRIILYLNGKELFQGTNAFRAKGLQYAGHVAMHANTVTLSLQKGINVLQCIVFEKANGWGLMGKFEDMEGIQIQKPL